MKKLPMSHNVIKVFIIIKPKAGAHLKCFTVSHFYLVQPIGNLCLLQETRNLGCLWRATHWWQLASLSGS